MTEYKDPSTVPFGHHVTNVEITYLAKAAHEVHRAYCTAIGHPSLGPWDDSGGLIRSDFEEVASLVMHGKGPRELHERWRNNIELHRQNGANIADDADVGWEQLPVELRTKLHLIVQAIKGADAEFRAHHRLRNAKQQIGECLTLLAQALRDVQLKKLPPEVERAALAHMHAAMSKSLNEYKVEDEDWDLLDQLGLNFDNTDFPLG